MTRVVENLRGDALGVAMDIGVEALLDEGGDRKLEEAMFKHIFPVHSNGAKALYNEGHRYGKASSFVNRVSQWAAISIEDHGGGRYLSRWTRQSAYPRND